MSNSLLEDVDQHVERLRSLQGRMPDGQRQQLQRQLTTFKIQLELVKQLSATQEELLKASTATGSRNGGPGSKTGPHAHHVAAHGAKTRTNGAQAAGTNGMQRPSNGLKRSASGLDGEDLLTGVFGVADTLAPDELHALAAQASVSPLQCRTMFERLRSGVRSYLQRMHSRMARSALAGAHAKLHGGAAVTQAGGEGGDQKAPQQKSVADEAGSRRERELARLNPVLDAQGGVDTQRTGSAGFALLMKVHIKPGGCSPWSARGRLERAFAFLLPGGCSFACAHIVAPIFASRTLVCMSPLAVAHTCALCKAPAHTCTHIRAQPC